MEALNRWIDSHSTLKHSVSEFFDACTNLRSVVASVQPFTSHTNLLAFEDILDQIRSHLDTISLMESQVHNSRIMLNGLLNESTLRTPINKLPSEILSRIFSTAISSSPCSVDRVHYDDALQVVPRVCQKWRQVAISHGSLWCHVDVRMPRSVEGCGPASYRMALTMSRTGGLPVHLHIANPYPEVPPNVVSEVVSIVRPYAMSYASLEIIGEDIATWAQDVFPFCSDPETSNSVKSIALTATAMNNDIVLPGNKFGSLLYLSVCSKENLTLELRDLAPVLSSCPNLHTLILKNLWITSDESYPIAHLPHLRFLQIIKLDGDGMQELARMIHPGTHEMDVGLDLNAETEHFPYVHALLARSNVVFMTAHLLEDGACDHVTRYLSAVPRLRSLMLVARTRFTSLLLKLSTEMLSPAGNESTLQVPLLQSLSLVHGFMPPSHINQWKNIIETRQLRIVGFLSCEFPSEDREEPLESDDEDASIHSIGFGSGEATIETMPESFKEWLSEREVQVVVAKVQTKQVYQDTDPVMEQLKHV